MDDKMINYGTNRSGMRKRRRRYNVKRIVALLVILIAIIAGIVMFITSLFTDKGEEVKNNDETNEEEEVQEVIVKPWDEMTDDQTISNLSGLPVLKSEATKRPVAIMYHNRLDTLPQAGLSSAEIVYEVPTDGEIVALLGIFQDISAEKFGPVRSIRKQVLDYALDNDAILVHYKSGEVASLGDSINAEIKKLNSPSIDAGDYEDEMTSSEVIAAGTVQAEATTSTDSKTTTSDQTVKFVSGTGIKSVWAKKGFTTLRDTENQIKLFKFGASDETKFDLIANVITVNYSYYQVSEFRYDTKTMTYKRFQTVGYKEAQQMDSMGTTETSDDTALEYKNVIVEYVDTTTDAATNNIEINTISTGDGLYFTNGTYMPIKWTKTDHYEPTKYTDLAGNEIELNRGRTWICIVPKTISAVISEETRDAGASSTKIVTKKVPVTQQGTSSASSDDETEDIGIIAGIDAMPNSARK